MRRYTILIKKLKNLFFPFVACQKSLHPGRLVRSQCIMRLSTQDLQSQKSTRSITKSPSLVSIRSVLTKIQPFQTLQFTEKCMDCRTSSIYFLVNFEDFECPISFNMGPINTKLDGILQTSVCSF